MATRRRPAFAAGCVVWRPGKKGLEVLLVHRPRWDDWSHPKGKLDRGEATIVAAHREVEEETGLRVRIGPRLRDSHYLLASGQLKVVSYWAARPPRSADDVSGFRPNSEIDEVAWVPLAQARSMLSYSRDVDLVAELLVSAYESSVLVILRHAEARKRKTWRRADEVRPLAAEGRRTAEALVPVLAAYGINRIVSSDATRCMQTVQPYADASGVAIRREPGLSEENSSRKTLTRTAESVLATKKRLLICTHRPVLPQLCTELDIPEVFLDPGEMIVVHRTPDKVLAVETPADLT